MRDSNNEKRTPVRVLLIEDDLMQGDVLYTRLSMQEGIELCGWAKEGREGLRFVEQYEPDVVLLDILMPNMDGLDFMRILQKTNVPKVPRIIVLTALGQKQIVNSALEQGAERYLVKPYDPELLADEILNGPVVAVHSDTPTTTQRVVKIALNLGIPTGSVGYRYFKSALHKLLEDDKRNIQLEHLYASIAQEYTTTVDCVERALRKIISDIFRANTETLREILRQAGVGEVHHLSNGRFLTMTAEYMLLQ